MTNADGSVLRVLIFCSCLFSNILLFPYYYCLVLFEFTDVGVFPGSGTHSWGSCFLTHLLTNRMCSQQDEGQEPLEEELDVLFVDDEGYPMSYPPMVCPLATPKIIPEGWRPCVPADCQSCQSDHSLPCGVLGVLLLWLSPLERPLVIWFSIYATSFPPDLFSCLLVLLIPNCANMYLFFSLQQKI